MGITVNSGITLLQDGLPPGGAAGQILTKVSNADFDATWSSGAPPSGAAGGDLTGTYPNPTIAANAVSNAKFRQSVGVSVVGRSASSTGNVADITATADNQVFRRVANVLGFGTITTASITGLGALATLNSVSLLSQVTDILPVLNGGTASDGSTFTDLGLMFYDVNSGSIIRTADAIGIDSTYTNLMIRDTFGDPRIWFGPDPTLMSIPTAALCTEVTNQLLDFGTNFVQSGGYVDSSLAGAFIRIDTRDTYRDQVLNLTFIDAFSSEVQVFKVGSDGAVVSNAGYYAASVSQLQGITNMSAPYASWADFKTPDTTFGALDCYGSGNQLLFRSGPSSNLLQPRTFSDIAVIIKGVASQSANLTQWQNSAASVLAFISKDGSFVFNEQGADADCRIEGDTDVNLFYTDASADTVQIGAATVSDSAKFYVSGKISTSGEMEINGALNHDGTTVGFYGVIPVARSSAYTPTNVTTDRSYDANSTTIDELADVLGTVIADLQLTGIIG